MRVGNLLFWTNFELKSGEKITLPVELLGKKIWQGEVLLYVVPLHRPDLHFWTTLKDAEEKTRAKIKTRGLKTLY